MKSMKMSYWLFMSMALLLNACKADLDVKPDSRLAVINSVKDMQALLDFFPRMNYNDPSTAIVCADEYYNTDAVLNARKESERNLYQWAPAYVFDSGFNAWGDVYEIVYYCNVVLNAVKENAGKLDAIALQDIEAQAKFHRSRQFLHAIDLWTLPYQPTTAASDLGIPLRMDADFNKVSTRASLAASYAQVIGDLKWAARHLPSQVISPMRSSKAAAYGMLARTYLRMRDYPQAGAYADSCLQLQASLLDYNSLNAIASFPIAALNKEVIFESRALPAGPVTNARALVSPKMYAAYEANDLRKTVFFRASGSDYLFKGHYAGAASLFNGLAVDEMLLTRAECWAQTGFLQKAVDDVNLLLKNRYRNGTFVPKKVGNKAEVLAMVKSERAKELFLRGQRWTDIRRWNSEGDQIVLERLIAGKRVELLPNSLRYALAIPEDIIDLTGMPQNKR